MDEAIQRFCNVTGSNQDVATQYLQMSEGNIERAIAVYFDTGSNNSNQISQPDTFRKPIPQKHERLIEPEPINSRYNMRSRQMDTRSNRIAGPSSDNNGSTSAYDKLYQPPNQLLFNGTFEEAKNFAKDKLKWLLVSVHNDLEFDCHVMNRDFWTDSNIINITKKSFILWQVTLGSSAADDFVKWYQYDSSKPHLALIDPSTGECKISFQENTMNPTSIHEFLISFLVHNDSNYTKQSHLQPGTSNSTFNSTNGCGKNKRKIGVNNDLQIDNSDDEPTHKKQKVQLSYPVTTINQSIKQLPDYTSSSFESTVKKTESVDDYIGNENDPLFTIILRLPNGERDTIVMPSSSKLKAIFLYLNNKGYCLNQYELVMMDPRQTLTSKMWYLTLADCRFVNRHLIIVQEIY